MVVVFGEITAYLIHFGITSSEQVSSKRKCLVDNAIRVVTVASTIAAIACKAVILKFFEVSAVASTVDTKATLASVVTKATEAVVATEAVAAVGAIVSFSIFCVCVTIDFISMFGIAIYESFSESVDGTCSNIIKIRRTGRIIDVSLSPTANINTSASVGAVE